MRFAKEKQRVWLEVSMDKLRHNVATLRALLPDGCSLMPAVKGNAYGLGAVEISHGLQHAGVNAFCVATLDEGIELREYGIEGDILILGYTPPSCAMELRQYRLTQTVVSRSHGASLAAQNLSLPVHVKIDTGMGRLGEGASDVDAWKDILTMKGIVVQGMYTKLASCASKSREAIDFTRHQLHAFNQALAQANTRKQASLLSHALCSYGIINYADYHYTYARPGAAIYGIIDETRCIHHPPTIHPIFQLKTRVAHVRRMHEGETVGYNQAFVAHRDMDVAVITAGYADGLPHNLSCGKGRVLIRGQFAPIIGVCMDQTMVDISGIPAIAIEDEVTLIGNDGENTLSIHDFAALANTIPNEVISRLGPRIQRVYL